MNFSIKLSNEQILRGMIKSPGENTKAVIILVHGIGEHIERYDYWADLFNKEGIAFTGLDLPGHGRSDGRRGDIKSYTLLNEMLDILLKNCNQTFPAIPVFIYGHSLGGGIVLNYLLHKNPQVKGAIVTAPFLRLAFEPPKIKLILAAIMKNLLPGLIQPSGLNSNHLSHDKNIVDKYNNDPLVHRKISVSLFYGAITAASYSLTHASELKVPTLILHGDEDLIISLSGSKEFASKTPMAELKIWEGSYHELHNEPFKNDVFNYILSWINKQLAS